MDLTRLEIHFGSIRIRVGKRYIRSRGPMNTTSDKQNKDPFGSDQSTVQIGSGYGWELTIYNNCKQAVKKRVKSLMTSGDYLVENLQRNPNHHICHHSQR